MKWNKEEALTFDDVLLVPQFCDIDSRKNVFTTTRLSRNVEIKIPIITANMDTVTEHEMAKKMHNLGGAGIFHRFMSIEGTVKCLQNMHPISDYHVSIGFNDDFEDRMDVYKRFGVRSICVDVAHGWCKRMIDTIKRIKEIYPEVDVIAGNVATGRAVHDLIAAGADAVKVGIGPGSMCTTRLVTGCGVPQLTAVHECSLAADEYEVPIIADGGITKSGDIVKALAAGASSVMVGSLVAGTDETPGEKLEDITSKKYYKKYRGMASDDAMTGWKGKDYHAAPEGESKIIECKGPVEPIITRLVAGVRSGMTYCNARSVEELPHKAVFRKVSANSLSENRPHGI